MEKQLPQQGNIQRDGRSPLQGAWTGDIKPVKLNHLYVSGKLADMPMYNKASDKNPTPTLNKQTIVQNLRRNQ